MDPTDPLADTTAPRYAIESDEEEDEPNPLRPSTSTPSKKPEIKIIAPSLPEGAPLIIASGRAGAFWVRGADLGEQQGGVFVDKVQVGLLFTPPHFTPSTVLISEHFTTLPLSYQFPYASAVLSTLRPSRVALLDTYSAPTYASDAPSGSLQDAPLRYLSTGEAGQIEGLLPKEAKEFSPPNLLQSTTAAFLLALQISSLAPSTIPSSLSAPSIPPSSPASSPNSTVILLPSLQLPTPAPKVLLPTHVPSMSSVDHEDSWSTPVMQSVSDSLLKLVGVETGEVKWKAKGDVSTAPPTKRRSEIGEGGMYL